MSKTRFECRHIISKNWAQMTPGSETLTYWEELEKSEGKYKLNNKEIISFTRDPLDLINWVFFQ